jgi:hypothetical protein
MKVWKLYFCAALEGEGFRRATDKSDLAKPILEK